MSIDGETLNIIGIAAAAYLLGSLPFAWLAGKFIRGIDIREHGSGNTGATNVWRVMGPFPGLTVGILDLAKGWLAVAMVSWMLQDSTRTTLISVEVLAGVLAVAGHSWPVWTGFRGGKGVLTAAGAFFYMAWLPMLCAIGVFMAVFLLTRYVSLGSMIAAISLPVFIVLVRGPWHRWQVLGISIFIAAFILYRHESNIRRLIRGEEHSFGRKSRVRARKRGGRRK
jgi:glycerol-3-phosphate acyltransferase PlsY